jgi:hypothetical protein
MGTFARAGAALDKLVAAILKRLPWEPDSRRRAWAAAVVFMAIAPAAFAATRQAQFTTQMVVFPMRVGPFPASHDVRDPARLLRDPVLRAEVYAATRIDPSGFRDVKLRPSAAQPTFILSASRSAPQTARRFLNAVALQLAYASGRQVVAEASARAAQLRQEIRRARGSADITLLRGRLARLRLAGSARVPAVERQLRLAEGRAAQRAALRRQLAPVTRVLQEPRNRYVASGPAPLPRLTRWSDKLVDALPGPFPRRPSPFWAGFAGLVLGVALWALALRVAPPRIRPTESDLAGELPYDALGVPMEAPARPAAAAAGVAGAGRGHEAVRGVAAVRRAEAPGVTDGSPDGAGHAAAVPVPGATKAGRSVPATDDGGGGALELRGLIRWVRSWQGAAWTLALVAVPLAVAVSIARHVVNVPFFDEWTGLVPLFQANDHGTLSFGMFWAEHNEHRPLIPRAIQFALAYITNWDTRVEVYVNLAVAIGTFVALLAALRRTLDRQGFVIASIVSSVVFFSPVQWENWLWGWQLEWFLSNLAAVGTVWALTVLLDRSPRWGLVVGAACGLVATFSLSQGLLIWPVGLMLLLLRRRPWVVWTLVSVGTYLLYFASWQDYTKRPDAGLLDYAHFVLLYLGRPFAVSNATGELVGAVVIASFVAAAGYVLANRRDSELVDRAVFWLGAGLYALGAAVITAFGRAGPNNQAVSRYFGMAGLFAIATMALLFVIVRRDEIAARPITSSTRRVAMAGIALALLLATLVNLRPGFNDMARRGDDLKAIAACTRHVQRASDPCLNRPLPVLKDVRFQGIVFLRTKGWAGY